MRTSIKNPITMTTRASEEEAELIRKYAELKGVTISDLIRNCVLEQIEDEFDATQADVMHEKIENGEEEIFDFTDVYKNWKDKDEV